MEDVQVVLVHGAWCSPGQWDYLADAVDARGLRSLRADLPSMRESAATFADDVEHVRSLAGETPSILCGHSYGGAVITQAASVLPRALHLVYLASVLPDVGESMFDWTLKRPMEGAPLEFHDDGTAMVTAWGVDDGRYDPAVLKLFHNYPARPMAISAATTPLTAAGWKTVPSTAVCATKDTVLHPDTQRESAARATRSLEMESDHLIQGVRPDEIASLLESLATAATPR
jgi:pimeloyl-ACP methyl ester carboxylesterase